MTTDKKSRAVIKWAAVGALAGLAFAVSFIPALTPLVTLFDRGKGLGAVFTAPGLTAVPPSWVLRFVFLLAALWGVAPACAPAARAAVRFLNRARAELGDWMLVGVLAVATGSAAAAFGYLTLGREGHVWDEREYDFQARIFAAGRFTAEAPVTDERVTLEGRGARNFLVGINEGVRDGKWFTIYLPIWPLVLAAGEISGHPWLVNPVIGVLTTFVIYGFGRRLFGADAALLSAVLYAFSPFIIFNNASFFSEPLFLLLLLLFLWAYITARDGGSRGAAVAAGVLLPLAFGAREYSTFAAALPLLAVWAAEAARRKPAKIPFSFFALGAGLGAVPLLSYNVVTSGTILQFPRFYALKTHFGLSLPFVSGDMLFFTTRRLWVLATDFLGWPLLSLLPALLPLFIRKVPAPARTLYAVALSTFILFILPHHKGINYGARYYYGALPAALLVGGYGLTLLPGWLKEKWSLPAGSAAAAVILAFIVTTPAYIAAAAPIYKDYWGFPEGKKPWVTPQLEQALAAYGVWQGIVFIAPPSRCEGPAPNDVDLKNNLIFARDRGPRNAAFAALWLPRPHLLVDYREFEETGVIHALELNLPPKTREKK